MENLPVAPALTSQQQLKVAKLTAIVTCVEYLNKFAEMNQEQILSDDEVAELVNRVDDKIPDESITTMDSEILKGEIIKQIANTAKELEEAQSGQTVVPSVTPADLHVQNIGSGTIIQEVARNPHANTGGVQLTPGVPVIETNLLTTNNQSGENKMATKVAKSREFEILRYELANNNVKMATLASALIKLAEEVSENSTSEVDKTKDSATTTEMQGLQDGSKPAEVTAPVAETKVDDLTKDPSKMTEEAADMAANNTLPGTDLEANEHKEAKAKSLKDLVKKYQKKPAK